MSRKKMATIIRIADATTFRVPPPDVRTRFVSQRYNSNEVDLIRRVASRHHRTISGFIRFAAFRAAFEMDRADQAQPPTAQT